MDYLNCSEEREKFPRKKKRENSDSQNIMKLNLYQKEITIGDIDHKIVDVLDFL